VSSGRDPDPSRRTRRHTLILRTPALAFPRAFAAHGHDRLAAAFRGAAADREAALSRRLGRPVPPAWRQPFHDERQVTDLATTFWFRREALRHLRGEPSPHGVIDHPRSVSLRG
jgi:hypothetical protein